MNAIDSRFQQLRAENKRAFLPFITAGDPDLTATKAVVEELARRGASLIEIGFPYSDPIADGPVIQASYTRALDRGLRINDIFDCIQQVQSGPTLQQMGTPLVGMISYSLIHCRGAESFLRHAVSAGLSGAIVPDLPLEETHDLAEVAASLDFKLIQLVTPTTPPQRAAEIAKSSTGFLYCVSVSGITGERDQLPQELLQQLAWLRTITDLPLCVGFGISKPDHVKMLRDAADGVIVGSAIVRRMEQATTKPVAQIVREIGDYVAELLDALRGSDKRST